ncbi:MAG: FG-GAP-like repeat-containing protein [Myxococcota bacterium]
MTRREDARLGWKVCVYVVAGCGFLGLSACGDSDPSPSSESDSMASMADIALMDVMTSAGASGDSEAIEDTAVERDTSKVDQVDPPDTVTEPDVPVSTADIIVDVTEDTSPDEGLDAGPDEDTVGAPDSVVLSDVEEPADGAGTGSGKDVPILDVTGDVGDPEAPEDIVGPLEDASDAASVDDVAEAEDVDEVPVSKAVPGWRMTFMDDFEGPEDPSDPCYDQAQTPAMCMDRYWSQVPCPEDVQAELALLNKCVWSVYDIYNWMDWDKPFGAGINKLDRRLVTLEGGDLVLGAALNPAKQTGSCGEDLGDGFVSADCPIHSGAVTSKAFGATPGFQQAYGRWEVRARLPEGPGAWPAHWLLPQSGGWPDAGEIDIMEAIAEKPTEVHGSFHGGTNDGEIRTHHSVHNWHDPEDARVTEGYHVYAVEWTPVLIRFFVDDLQIGVLHEGTLLESKILSAPDEALEGTSAGLLPVQIPDTAFHWILNTSIVPTGGLAEDLSNFSEMSHRIDWVKVYEPCLSDEPSCELPVPHSARVTEDPELSALTWSAEERVAHIGDFDGDGAQDVLLRSKTTDVPTYWVAGAPGLETFAPAVDITDDAWMTAALWSDTYRDTVVGDFDGDGADDVLMPPRGEWHEAYLLLGGAAPFNPHAVVTESWGMSYALWATDSRRAHAADVTGDDVDDLLLVGLGATDPTYLLEATGDGGFYPPVDLGQATTLTTAQWSDETHSVSLGDFNGDGATDVLLQGDSDAVQTWLMLSDGAGGFAANDVTATPWMTAGKWSTEHRVPHVGDFDGDGASDLLLQTAGEGHASYLFLSDGLGGFVPEQVVTDSFWMSEVHWSDVYRQGVVGDFDGDGKDDMLLVSRGEGHATYFLRADGLGGFEPVRVVTDLHMLSDGLWSTERHRVHVGAFDGPGWYQLLLQGADAEEDSFWVDLHGAL